MQTKLMIGTDGRIDKERLRTEILSALEALKKDFLKLTTSERYHTFWHDLHREISVSRSGPVEKKPPIDRMLLHLPTFCQSWIDTAVDTPERFNFFIESKATEVQSGDVQQDYYQALCIRHDQLIAVVSVLSKLKEVLETWVASSAAEARQDPYYLGLEDTDVEGQIYLEAQIVAKEREAHLKDQ